MVYGEPMDKVKIEVVKQSESSNNRAISFESMLSDGNIK